MTTASFGTDASTAKRLARYVELVRDSEHNLVSRRARAELETRHLPECVALARLLPAGDGRLLDVGSGGGLPGLVIAMVRPDLDVHLLDATAKKTAFLQVAAAEVEVPVTIHTGRAEELQRGELAGAFDVVTARAVAALDRLVGWTLPFLRPGGVLYAVKGAQWSEELANAATALRRHHATVIATPDDVHPRGGDTTQEASPRVVMLARMS